MSNTTTFAVPTSQGLRLRELAKRLGKTAGAVLVELIDTACDAAGVGVQKPAARVERDERLGTYALTLFETYVVTRAGITLDRLASALIEVADTGGVKDGTNFVVIRKGAGLTLGIEAVDIRTGELGAQSLNMSPLIAKLIASTIRQNLVS